MKFRGGEFSTGTTGNFQPELTKLKKTCKTRGFLPWRWISDSGSQCQRMNSTFG